jgi:hypothetical protein
MERMATTRAATMERKRLPALRLRSGSPGLGEGLDGVGMCCEMR